MKQKSVIQSEVLSFKQTPTCEKCAYLERSSEMQGSGFSVGINEDLSSKFQFQQSQIERRYKQEFVEKMIPLQDVLILGFLI
jgi:hypothetical protein